MKQWLVEQLFTYGWDEAPWTEDDGSGPVPMRFDCPVMALAEIYDLIHGVRDAVACGHMAEEYHREDYRVVPVREE